MFEATVLNAVRLCAEEEGPRHVALPRAKTTTREPIATLAIIDITRDAADVLQL